MPVPQGESGCPTSLTSLQEGTFRVSRIRVRRGGRKRVRFGAPDGLFSAEELRHGIHGGAWETSIMLARYPEAVRKDKIADFRPTSIAMEQEYRWLSAHRPVPFAWQTQDLHASGAVGDAAIALSLIHI